MATNPHWETVSFVLSSAVRTNVLDVLRGQRSTPSQIAKHVDQPLSHVSRALRELQSKTLVILLTPGRTKARLYEITDRGREVSEKVASLRGGRKP